MPCLSACSEDFKCKLLSKSSLRARRHGISTQQQRAAERRPSLVFTARAQAARVACSTTTRVCVLQITVWFQPIRARVWSANQISRSIPARLDSNSAPLRYARNYYLQGTVSYLIIDTRAQISTYLASRNQAESERLHVYPHEPVYLRQHERKKGSKFSMLL